MNHSRGEEEDREKDPDAPHPFLEAGRAWRSLACLHGTRLFIGRQLSTKLSVSKIVSLWRLSQFFPTASCKVSHIAMWFTKELILPEEVHFLIETLFRFQNWNTRTVTLFATFPEQGWQISSLTALGRQELKHLNKHTGTAHCAQLKSDRISVKINCSLCNFHHSLEMPVVGCYSSQFSNCCTRSPG